MRKNVKNLILLICLAFGGYQLWETFGNRVEPLYDRSYVAVYGRGSCGYTQKMLADLSRKGVLYMYFDVDNPMVAGGLHKRMKLSGLSTGRYNLPVVDVNGKMETRPQYQDVVNDYWDKF